MRSEPFKHKKISLKTNEQFSVSKYLFQRKFSRARIIHQRKSQRSKRETRAESMSSCGLINESKKEKNSVPIKDRKTFPRQVRIKAHETHLASDRTLAPSTGSPPPTAKKRLTALSSLNPPRQHTAAFRRKSPAAKPSGQFEAKPKYQAAPLARSLAAAPAAAKRAAADTRDNEPPPRQRPTARATTYLPNVDGGARGCAAKCNGPMDFAPRRGEEGENKGRALTGIRPYCVSRSPPHGCSVSVCLSPTRARLIAVA